ncbi:MAG: multidrug effflux MFS transporter [Phyllobacteriaceae bacterium]|nr:multidrug effflux MFS transporter [Phyllobacteriaceae bacterium]
MALLVALNALAIDVLLPGMQEIGASLGEADENRRQFIITAYFGGFGLGQLVFGPLSDRYGRLPPLFAGMAIYAAAAATAPLVTTFDTLLLLRFAQGAGAASTRALSTAITRDVSSGRAMAEIMSLVMTVFMIMPIVAPALGQAIMIYSDWRTVFVFMALAAVLAGVWTWKRIPETLHPSNRRPFDPATLLAGAVAVATNRVSFWYSLALTLIFGALFGFINSAQQIYVGVYGLGVWFPAAFAGVAIMVSVASFTNSRLVRRFGPRRVSHMALAGDAAGSMLLFLFAATGLLPLWLFLVLFAAMMMAFGFVGPNFSALAMEPLGHLAGMAAAVQGTVQTVGSALIGAAIGQAFDGTVLPFAAGSAGLGLGALVCVHFAAKRPAPARAAS